MKIQDLETISAAEFLQYHLVEVQMRLAMVTSDDDASWEHVRNTESKCSFKFSKLGYNKEVLQQAACKLYLNGPADALADLNWSMLGYTDHALPYQYRAAAHQALGNDIAAAEDLASAEQLTPHPDFVVVNHLVPQDDWAMYGVTVGQKQQVYMAAIARKTGQTAYKCRL